MSTMIKTLCAGMIAALSSFSNVQAADAAPVSPGYLGADIGAIVADGNTRAITRVYGGLTIGSSTAFDLQQVHALELMLYTTRMKEDAYGMYADYYIPGIKTQANGAALSWTTAVKLNDKWSLTSRLGATYTHTKRSYELPNSYNWSRDTANVIAGVGAAYKLSPNISATVDVNYMPIKLDSYSKSDPAVVSAGLKYNF
ncbi:outer membrane beta-barrel protein [Burkholderia sp. LMU1-1-1.1]|uniref:outer membrane beta-barrel protein n=1 Tax=Burkholderia sp. LMU1-1-1.1 TaxID=3135266 RepID=UPI003416CF11